MKNYDSKMFSAAEDYHKLFTEEGALSLLCSVKQFGLCHSDLFCYDFAEKKTTDMNEYKQRYLET